MTSTTAYLLYLIFALGGAGVYLLLPKGNVSQTRAGLVVGLLAAMGLVTVWATRIVASDNNTGYFYLFSLIAMLSAVRVITHPKPVYSALYFVLVVIAVAALLVLLQAEFLAVALIIVYAGAILVTYLFVIMLAQQGGSPVYDRRSREPFMAVLAGFVLMAAVAGRAVDSNESTETGPALAGDSVKVSLPVPAKPTGNTSAIGRMVMTRYVVTLEAAGLLLLVSMVGAIALSRKKVPTEGYVEPSRPIGQAGREAEPF